MPRFDDNHPARVGLHVVRSGRGHAQCFFDDRDRLAFLEHLGESARRFECAIHAYVLMGNHVHLLLTAEDGEGTARLMSAVCEAHERSVGAMPNHRPVLWDEAFKASPIHARRHFLACMRYVELNPVRAGLVRRASAYRWSSYRANAMGAEDALITPHPFFFALGRTGAERREAYKMLCADGRATSLAQTPGGQRIGLRGPSRRT